MPEPISRRARHVVTENARVLESVKALKHGDINKFGQLMKASHNSLRDDYEVSCRELDVMVEIASRQRGVYGARMTGGGFGGCTVNLVDAADASEFKRRVSAEYASATNRQPDIYICEASQGAEAALFPAEDVPSVPV